MDQLKIQPQALAEMISLIEDTTISGKIAKDILPDLLEGKGNGGVKVRSRDGQLAVVLSANGAYSLKSCFPLEFLAFWNQNH